MKKILIAALMLAIGATAFAQGAPAAAGQTADASPGVAASPDEGAVSGASGTEPSPRAERSGPPTSYGG